MSTYINTMTATSLEENKALVRQWADAIIWQDYAALAGTMTPELEEEWKKFLNWIYSTYDHHRSTVTGLIAEGDQVWLHIATGGDHMGDHQPGNAHTGLPWKNQGIYFLRIQDGRIVSAQGFFDTPQLA